MASITSVSIAEPPLIVYVEVQLMNGLTPKREYISGPLPRMGRVDAARARHGRTKPAPLAIAPAINIWRRLKAADFSLFVFMMQTPDPDRLAVIVACPRQSDNLVRRAELVNRYCSFDGGDSHGLVAIQGRAKVPVSECV